MPRDNDTPLAPPLVGPRENHPELFEQLRILEVFDVEKLPVEFGDYRLLELVGEGGAGAVFRATRSVPKHSDCGEEFAVKLIRSEVFNSAIARKRFEKEARLHSQIDSPYINRLVDFGCESTVYFIASEFIHGLRLDELHERKERLTSQDALRIIRDVLRALSEMHGQGLIHRDVKPENIMVTFQAIRPRDEWLQMTHLMAHFHRARLTDFGLARAVDQSKSMAMTHSLTVLGTPLYMAPEQQRNSSSVNATADIYSVGATLYHVLAGSPPFDATDPIKLAEQHRNERPRPVHVQNKRVGEAVSNVVAKALEKNPALRYANASEMLADIESVLNHTPISIRPSPQQPSGSLAKVWTYDFEFQLEATPYQLWPLVSDTDRFNRALGLPAPEFTHEHRPGMRRTFAETRFLGARIRWQEHPFQWVFARELSVLREFESGPFEWLTSTVELYPSTDGQTRLLHRFKVLPRGWLGRLVTPIQFKLATSAALRRTYAEIERMAVGENCGPFPSELSFSSRKKQSFRQRDEFKRRSQQLQNEHSNRPAAKQLLSYLETAADPLVASIRPGRLASQLACSLDQTLEVCLAAVQAGLVNMSWDLICPVCRVAADNVSSLEQISTHARCEVCNLGFAVDFAETVEVVFGIHPAVRSVDRKVYCVGGPFHAPHVIAQNHLPPNQSVTLGVELGIGRFSICSPQLDENIELDVIQDGESDHVEICFDRSRLPGILELRPGQVAVHLHNATDREVQVRLERLGGFRDAVTAAMAQQHPLFRELFSGQPVAPRQLVELDHRYVIGIGIPNRTAVIQRIGELRWREMLSRIQAGFAPVRGEIVDVDDPFVIAAFRGNGGGRNGLCRLLRTLATAPSITGEICISVRKGKVLIGNDNSLSRMFGETIRASREDLCEGVPGRMVLHKSVENTHDWKESLAGFLEIDDSPRQLEKRGPDLVTFRLKKLG